jgi:hypothetical protein
MVPYLAGFLTVLTSSGTGFICSSDAADEDRLAEEDVDRFVDRKMDEDTFSGPDAFSGRTERLDAA